MVARPRLPVRAPPEHSVSLNRLVTLLAQVLRPAPDARIQGDTITYLCRSPPSSLPSLLWMAPVLTGGGYSSEAIGFALGLAAQQHKISLRQFAE